MLQMFVLIGGAITVTVIGLFEIGGWSALQTSVDDSFWSVWKPMSDPDFPWTGIVFGAPILGVWYWCTDQFIVQRVLSASDQSQARKGTLFGGFLKQLPLFIFVLPGIIAYALSQSGQLELASPDQALPTLIGVLLPVGFRGLVVAGLLAALMSSLSSVFNSCSTLVTWDIYKKMHPAASEKQLVWVGQLSTIAMVALGLAWIPFMDGVSDQLFVYLQSVQGYIAPPIAAVFLIGLAWKRVNARGAIASLLTGFVIGMSRLIAELYKDGLSGSLFTFADINFLHFAAFLFLVCAAVLIVVSLATQAPSDAKLANLTFATTDGLGAEGDDSRKLDLMLTLGLVAIIVIIWIVFA
jgi:SSS family solute:Na+ symporter